MRESQERSPEPLLDVTGLKTVFRTKNSAVHAVNGISFSLGKGECLAVVGESGSGKSVAMMSLVHLLTGSSGKIAGGRAIFNGVDLTQLGPAEIRKIRGREIGFVFQDPMTSLNPVLTIGYQIMEPLREHKGLSRKQALTRAVELLQLVGIPAPHKRVHDYPHQFSGGMRQRIVIAIALACDPKLLIADEPTTALDVTVQAQIVELLKDLREQMGMAIIWITHDLGVAAGMANRVMVMYGGLVVENARVGELFSNPRHPYTQALLDALPGRHPPELPLRSIGGQPPLLTKDPTFCPFAPRCPHAFSTCIEKCPPLASLGKGHEAACWWSMNSGNARAA